METAILIGFWASLYFLPTVIAWKRQHHNALAVTVTNALLGWTFIGWVAALIWSCTKVEITRSRSAAAVAIGKFAGYYLWAIVVLLGIDFAMIGGWLIYTHPWSP